ncbi:MAG: hypothetical protein GY761_12040 [Hyphomicrobiales bacterium]|nr:hypothetical protein [Hyphomicrobiales bacterium]
MTGIGNITRFTRQGAKKQCHWLIGQVLPHFKINRADQLAWFTEDRLFMLNGLRYGFVVVNQTTAKIMPCQ